MTEEETTITIPRPWIVGFCAVGAAVGLGAAFVVGPLVEWLISTADGAPGALRIAARLPLAWAIPVLTLAGAAVGFWITREWRREVGVVKVSASGITIENGRSRQHIDRQRIGGIFTDGKDLVVTDPQTNELSRSKTDAVLAKRQQHAFKGLGYPWLGTSDPYESAWLTWTDGGNSVDARVDNLLRTRQRALTDKRLGAADDARDELRSLGVVVRDRDHTQQYREIPRI